MGELTSIIKDDEELVKSLIAFYLACRAISYQYVVASPDTTDDDIATAAKADIHEIANVLLSEILDIYIDAVDVAIDERKRDNANM